MKPPCRGCEHEFLDKRYPYIWIESPNNPKECRTTKNRSLVHKPGKNYPNPCYSCKKRELYDDYNSLSLDCGPTYYASSFEPTRILNAEA